MFHFCSGRLSLESKSQLWSILGTSDQLNLRWKWLGKGCCSLIAFVHNWKSIDFPYVWMIWVPWVKAFLIKRGGRLFLLNILNLSLNSTIKMPPLPHKIQFILRWFVLKIPYNLLDIVIYWVEDFLWIVKIQLNSSALNSYQLMTKAFHILLNVLFN